MTIEYLKCRAYLKFEVDIWSKRDNCVSNGTIGKLPHGRFIFFINYKVLGKNALTKMRMDFHVNEHNKRRE